MTLDSRLVNLAATGRTLLQSGLVRGSGGNISLRWDELCYISPAGARLDRLTSADFVPLNVQAQQYVAAHARLQRARPASGVLPRPARRCDGHASSPLLTALRWGALA